MQDPDFGLIVVKPVQPQAEAPAEEIQWVFDSPDTLPLSTLGGQRLGGHYVHLRQD